MTASPVWEILVEDRVYQIEGSKLGNGVRATVTLVDEAGQIVHRHRFDLDSAPARQRFADAAGTPADDLNVVRETIVNHTRGAAASDTPKPPDPAVQDAAQALLTAPDLLDRMRATVTALGYAGDTVQPALVYLVLTSRLLAQPINLVVGGPSAAGKSFVVALVAKLFPAAATHPLTGMSERALIYSEADLQHRMLIVQEAAALERDGIGATIMRSIIWGGNVIYDTVESTPQGSRPVHIEKEGPTGLITTTTKSLEPELATRMLAMSVADDAETTRTIILATAERATGLVPVAPDLDPWHEAQRWLAEEGAHEVVIPYALTLGGLYPDKQVRARRDVPQLLALLQASAVLHQQRRERDAEGRIVADEDDYRVVYDLAAPIFGAIAQEGVTPEVREAVAAVAELTTGGSTTTVAQVATAVRRDKSTAQRRVKQAIAGDWLVNDEPVKGKPYMLRLGDPLPEDRPALPAPEQLFGGPPCNPATPTPGEGQNPSNNAENGGAESLAQGVTTGAQPPQPPSETAAEVARVAPPLRTRSQPQTPSNHAEFGPKEGEGCGVAAEGEANSSAGDGQTDPTNPDADAAEPAGEPTDSGEDDGPAQPDPRDVFDRIVQSSASDDDSAGETTDDGTDDAGADPIYAVPDGCRTPETCRTCGACPRLDETGEIGACWVVDNAEAEAAAASDKESD